jgi:hypothetical protein
MKIVLHPKLHPEWTQTYWCACGAKLQGDIKDVFRKCSRDTDGVEVVSYFFLCPICKHQKTLHTLPDTVIHIVDSIAAGKMEPSGSHLPCGFKELPDVP